MTVKCLTEQEKLKVVYKYQRGAYIQDIADWMGVSPRTISRVLAEANLLSPTERMSEEAKKIKRILVKYGLTVNTLDAALSILEGSKNANRTSSH